MNYYKLSYSLVRKEIGDFPQSDTMVADYDYRAFNSINKIDFTSKIPFTPNLDAIKLTKKAKILDLINSVTVSTSGLIISDSLKKIFHDFNCDPDLQVFDIRLVRNEDSWNYLFYYNFKERLSFLDFESMNFFQTRMLGLDPQPIRINSLDEFLKFEKAEGRYINPDKLIFKSPDYDLFRLYSICGGYYVSERLMNAIKEAGMTGIAFKPLDELVFLR